MLTNYPIFQIQIPFICHNGCLGMPPRPLQCINLLLLDNLNKRATEWYLKLNMYEIEPLLTTNFRLAWSPATPPHTPPPNFNIIYNNKLKCCSFWVQLKYSDCFHFMFEFTFVILITKSIQTQAYHPCGHIFYNKQYYIIIVL